MRIEKIRVSVTTITEDGNRSELVFKMDPNTFQMSQDREVRPVQGTGEDRGKVVDFEIDPNRKGTRLAISGNLIEGGRYKWPK